MVSRFNVTNIRTEPDLYVKGLYQYIVLSRYHLILDVATALLKRFSTPQKADYKCFDLH